MSAFDLSFLTRAAFAAALLSLGSHAPLARVLAAEPSLDAGVLALQQGRFDDAHRLLNESLAGIRGSGLTNREADLFFFLGLSRQQAALARPGDAEQGTLLRAATGYYQESLRVRPGMASVLNNLAQCQVRLGDTTPRCKAWPRRSPCPIPGAHFTRRTTPTCC
jgi:hypothetical protein